MVAAGPRAADLQRAYASCVNEARGHYENFPVASFLVPRTMRRHVAAVYAFARAADDFADEGERTADVRRTLLDGWLQRLQDAAPSAAGSMERAAWPEQSAPRPGEPQNAPAVFLALGASIRSVPLPLAPFEDLLSAFRQDVDVTRYASWTALLDYCRRSANPVGRLVLRIAGYDEARLDAWSDAICTALQLTNFWQDLKIDFDRGRIYLPEEERSLHGAEEADLAAGHVTEPWQRALSAATGRTRALFMEGRPLCDAVRGRLRLELRATWLGGMRVLDRLERVAFDVVRRRPSLGARDALWIAGRLLT